MVLRINNNGGRAGYCESHGVKHLGCPRRRERLGRQKEAMDSEMAAKRQAPQKVMAAKFMVPA